MMDDGFIRWYSQAQRTWIRRSHTEEIARNLPNTTALLLPGNHFAAAGNPEAFNAAVLDFLKG